MELIIINKIKKDGIFVIKELWEQIGNIIIIKYFHIRITIEK